MICFTQTWNGSFPANGLRGDPFRNRLFLYNRPQDPCCIKRFVCKRITAWSVCWFFAGNIPSKRTMRWSVYKRIFLYNRLLDTAYHGVTLHRQILCHLPPLPAHRDGGSSNLGLQDSGRPKLWCWVHLSVQIFWNHSQRLHGSWKHRIRREAMVFDKGG